MAGKDPSTAGVAGRYASALFALAQEEGRLDAVAEELGQIRQALSESADFARFVKSPVFSRAERERALAAILSAMGISGLTAAFLGVVARNGRLSHLAEMLAAFDGLLARHRGIVMAEIRTATPLTETQAERLKAALEDTLSAKVEMESRVDPTLLGGLAVKVGSRMIDNSLRTKLDALKIAMKEVG